MKIKRRARCESCRFMTKLYHTGPSYKQKGEDPNHPGFFVCRLCHDSFASNALAHPRSYDNPTLGTICHVGNAILEKLRDMEALRGR